MARSGSTPNEAVIGSTRQHEPVNTGCGLSAEAYRRRHEISVSVSFQAVLLLVHPNKFENAQLYLVCQQCVPI